MPFRFYKIKLEPATNHSIPAEIPGHFGVLITDPSNLVPSGSTKKRGLSFLDKEGIVMEHKALKHVPIWDKPPYPITEEDEIAILIRKKIGDYFKVNGDQLNVQVSRA